MALQYKPTRMELSNLKKRRTVAIRGHKMMKDKRDELVRRFIILARKNKALRADVEKKLGEAMQNFVLARAMMSSNEIEEALMYPARAVSVEMGKQNILSIQVPKLSLDTQDGFEYPYGFATTIAASSSESSPSPLASNAATRTDLSVASAKAIALLGAVTGRMNFLAYRSLHAETDPFLNSYALVAVQCGASGITMELPLILLVRT